MWNPRRITIAAAAVLVIAGVVVAVILAQGAGSDQNAGPRVVQPGAPGESGRTLTPEELASLTAPPHNAADIEFFERMIPHHGQALEMTALVPARSSNEDVHLLAERMEISQTEEIARMQEWLTARGLPSVDPGHHGAHDMPGMLTEEQLAELGQAQGVAFDRLFLEFMIYHHQGAVTMANELYTRGGGLEPASDRFAREVISDQGIEISRMLGMLAALPA